MALQRFTAYQYSNQKLGEFLTRLKQSPLRDKLIVAVTGDHSFWMVNFSDQEHLQKWGVPFLLVLPPSLRRQTLKTALDFKEVYGSHFDIFPTLYPLALSEVEFDAFGTNLLAVAPQNSMALFSNFLAVSPQGGILAQKGQANYAPFQWDVSQEKLEPASPNGMLEQLDKKYKSLMSLLDFYFMKESERMKKGRF